MYFLDFYYDGEKLSDYKCVVASFSDGGIEDRTLGSNLTFNTVSQLSGQHYLLASTQYDEVLTAEFDIVKNPCIDNYTEYFTQAESRAIMRWLNRRAFLKFKPIYASGEAHDDIFFEGSFNVTAKNVNGKTVGFTLALTTNRPFGLLEAVTYTMELRPVSNPRYVSSNLIYNNNSFSNNTHIEDMEMTSVGEISYHKTIRTAINDFGKATYVAVINEKVFYGTVRISGDRYYLYDVNDPYGVTVGYDDYSFWISRPSEIGEVGATISYYIYVSTGNSPVNNYILADMSDEVGFIYCDATVTCQEAGDLEITNAIENRTTVIKNVTAGEVITMNFPIVETSIASHKIQNDFDFDFLRIANTYDNRINTFSANLPCTIMLTYNPIRKVGI